MCTLRMRPAYTMPYGNSPFLGMRLKESDQYILNLAPRTYLVELFFLAMLNCCNFFLCLCGNIL